MTFAARAALTSNRLLGLAAVIGLSLLASAWPAAAILIGAIAGLLPALRAARMSPTEALRTA
jgi:putative ABC transport system permease protein